MWLSTFKDKVKVSLYIKAQRVVYGPKMMCGETPKSNEWGRFLPKRGLLIWPDGKRVSFRRWTLSIASGKQQSKTWSMSKLGWFQVSWKQRKGSVKPDWLISTFPTRLNLERKHFPVFHGNISYFLKCTGTASQVGAKSGDIVQLLWHHVLNICSVG